ncbi:MAG: hypothetical protein ACFFCQ_16615 [Promethearchaeota archaeon]
MILKDLWIVSRAGICLYHYQIMPSNYDEYENLFSGFISTLSALSTTFSNNQIDFIVMGTEKLHFLSIKEIIIASTIIFVREEGAADERSIIKQLLKSVGEIFLVKYAMKMKQEGFNFDFIKNEFDHEIYAIYRVYEGIPRKVSKSLK